jgi:hypothetical protein
LLTVSTYSKSGRWGINFGVPSAKHPQKINN